MSPAIKFLIRAVLSLGLAIIMSRLFFQRTSYSWIIGLAVFFMGMGYLLEYIRKRG